MNPCHHEIAQAGYDVEPCLMTDVGSANEIPPGECRLCNVLSIACLREACDRETVLAITYTVDYEEIVPHDDNNNGHTHMCTWA
jgi:hypothetical protein